MMRIAGLVMASVNPIMSAHIRAALVMGSRDMTVDGPALRACFPSIPMTTAVEVAHEMFAPEPDPAMQPRRPT